MIVVSNTSPIINLAAVNKLELLHQLYGEILIPEAVYNEIVVDGEGQPGEDEVKKLDWIKSGKVENLNLLKAMHIELHDGEAEAIVLAIQIGADLLLQDSG